MGCAVRLNWVIRFVRLIGIDLPTTVCIAFPEGRNLPKG